jgi:hypothetical protein
MLVGNFESIAKAKKRAEILRWAKITAWAAIPGMILAVVILLFEGQPFAP